MDVINQKSDGAVQVAVRERPFIAENTNESDGIITHGDKHDNVSKMFFYHKILI